MSSCTAKSVVGYRTVNINTINCCLAEFSSLARNQFLTTPVIPAAAPPAAGPPRRGRRFLANTTTPPSHTEKRRSPLSSHKRQLIRLPLWDLWWNPAPLVHPVPPPLLLVPPLLPTGGGGGACDVVGKRDIVCIGMCPRQSHTVNRWRVFTLTLRNRRIRGEGARAPHRHKNS